MDRVAFGLVYSLSLIPILSPLYYLPPSDLPTCSPQRPLTFRNPLGVSITPRHPQPPLPIAPGHPWPLFPIAPRPLRPLLLVHPSRPRWLPKHIWLYLDHYLSSLNCHFLLRTPSTLASQDIISMTCQPSRISPGFRGACWVTIGLV